MSLTTTAPNESLLSTNFAPSRATPPLVELPRPRTGRPVALGLAVLLAFGGGLGAFSVLVPLSEAAIAPGVIKAEGSRRTVAHLEGGIVREILVRDGNAVRAGQLLMRLEDVQAASNQDALQAQRWALLAQDSRIAAEIAGAAEIAFAPALVQANEARATEAMNGQRVLFASRQASLRSQLQVLESRILQHQAVGTSAEAQLQSQRRQLELLQREEADVRGLVRQGLERMPRLLALQRQLASTEGTIADLVSQIERARAMVAEAQAQIRQVMDQRLQEVTTEGREVRIKLADVEEKLRAAADVSARHEILAPEDGTVLNIRFFNPGAVVRPGEPVMELVPARDKLIAEVQVAPHDIDVVHAGLQAEVRLPAFKQRLVPFLNGEVTVVAGDVTSEERTMREYYRVRIAIDEEQLARLENVELRAGMPVEAQIQIGERSFLRYMIQPILDSFHRAFREQ
ncbi:HlyD family type I secretion periplasmic adaptor subunit [Roseomonas xinghualingensis]|uniref:HlyD family type I secretion periplasmic adaptor subunit n=1 Tax=Roseomonas xinghualingensis TaxID=2986475 RepID=UPI0021F1E9C4|nr:HlyD family type I secretion periplasmic adaptor subunit [Roseomonas sp. SXEYE001]MCV4209128.1 HlyD family type I secretion periplasmic adaptor subunit [Roseomonas sp. SXEYE001]